MSGVVKGVKCAWICFTLPLCASVSLPVLYVWGRGCVISYMDTCTVKHHVRLCVNTRIIHIINVWNSNLKSIVKFDCVCVCYFAPKPVHRGRPSSVRAARWCRPRSCSAAAGLFSCVETACWSSTSLSQNPAALWPASAQNGTTPGEKDTQPFDVSPLSSLFLQGSCSIPVALDCVFYSWEAG